MPKMDGLTALEQIMQFDKSARVVMISALGKEELVKKALLLGAKNFIIKPRCEITFFSNANLNFY